MPYISKHAVNCTDRPAEPRFKPAADGQPLRELAARGLTLAWVCDRHPWSSHVDMDEAPDGGMDAWMTVAASFLASFMAFGTGTSLQHLNPRNCAEA